MDKVFVFTKNCKIRQQMMLLSMGLLLFSFLFFLFIDYSPYTALLVFILASVIILFNLFVARIYEIKIKERVIVVENMWRRAEYPLDELIDVRLIDFRIPYPFNPYLKFVLKDSRTYVGIIPNRAKYYLSNGGIKRYVNDLKADLLK